MIRRFKPFYQLYNLFQKKKLEHNLALYKKYGIKKRYHDPISSKDFEDLPEIPNTYDWLDSAQHLPNNQIYQKLPVTYQNALLNWSENGYAVLPEFFDPETVDKINEEVAPFRAEQPDEDKLIFLIHKSDLLKEVGNDPRLISILEMLMDKRVELFQSLNFKMGSEQRTHSDSIHMSTYPKGNLIAAWIALEDIGPDQGPLHYYPGSHQLPYIMNADYDNEGTRFWLGDRADKRYEDKIQEVVDSNNLKKKFFHARKGDVFIWHANLLHGGEPQNNKSLTRKSMVFHYYTEDAICYHEVTQRPTLKQKS